MIVEEYLSPNSENRKPSVVYLVQLQFRLYVVDVVDEDLKPEPKFIRNQILNREEEDEVRRAKFENREKDHQLTCTLS